MIIFTFIQKWVNICFTEETEILTEEGTKQIKDIKVGDKVFSKNEFTGEKAYKEVVRLFRNKVSELVVIKINGKTIRTTSEHPFWTKNRGWVGAKELTEEDILEDAEENEIYLESIEIKQFDEPINVYNFEVKDFHTYYVSEEFVLVHNKCKGIKNLAENCSIDSKVLKELKRMGQKVGGFFINFIPYKGTYDGLDKLLTSEPWVIIIDKEDVDEYYKK
ncbi:polymorphic toxin-type HINT domain-containing protein [Oceanirhabdus sp. W0125-5]|uniref:polymorphic toxin-type HINT domain-containing protein n=1 Tax=Oceanirhabdus sp. W0125-5 TaxID=2999116 RepID=UPI0022F2FBBC|nr:polymorphic toxin-type HINT domain-containing protein [Oceanirhabdus sp. W0125-5]WBW98162.1 polymorphic toxin-type HINT domain-containing protein [Oceanirhabdus sp. W0125-5]